MKAYAAYLFDADGTLFDTREMIYQSYRGVTEAFGLPDPDREKVAPLIGMVMGPQMDILLGPLTDAERDRAVAAYRARQATLWRDYLRPFPDAKETLAALRGRGAKLAVVTSRSEASLVEFLRETGLDGAFDALVTPRDTARHKPDPEPARLALARLAVRPEETLFIGDASFDVECGHAAGVDTALVAWGMDPADFAVAPDYIITRFDELLTEGA